MLLLSVSQEQSENRRYCAPATSESTHVQYWVGVYGARVLAKLWWKLTCPHLPSPMSLDVRTRIVLAA